MTCDVERLLGLAKKIQEQVVLLKQAPLEIVDELTVYDVDKAYRQFEANIERALRDARRRLAAPVECYHQQCTETEGLYECEDCGLRFCDEHGQVGGDRQVQDVGAVAYPSICDRCRGIE